MRGTNAWHIVAKDDSRGDPRIQVGSRRMNRRPTNKLLEPHTTATSGTRALLPMHATRRINWANISPRCSWVSQLSGQRLRIAWTHQWFVQQGQVNWNAENIINRWTWDMHQCKQVCLRFCINIKRWGHVNECLSQRHESTPKHLSIPSHKTTSAPGEIARGSTSEKFAKTWGDNKTMSRRVCLLSTSLRISLAIVAKFEWSFTRFTSTSYAYLNHIGIENSNNSSERFNCKEIIDLTLMLYALTTSVCSVPTASASPFILSLH